jgi:Fimbrial assembly protein (PilN)
MRRVALDFQPRRRRVWLGWLLLALSAVAAGQLVMEFRALQAEVALAEGRAARLAARVDGRDAERPRSAQGLAEELVRARAVTRQLTLPWGDVFDAVESAAAANVALIALQPDGTQDTVRITAETRNLDDALAFVRRLKATRRLSGVHLASHQVREQDAQRPVRFVVMAGFGRGGRS